MLAVAFHRSPFLRRRGPFRQAAGVRVEVSGADHRDLGQTLTQGRELLTPADVLYRFYALVTNGFADLPCTRTPFRPEQLASAIPPEQDLGEWSVEAVSEALVLLSCLEQPLAREVAPAQYRLTVQGVLLAEIIDRQRRSNADRPESAGGRLALYLLESATGTAPNSAAAAPDRNSDLYDRTVLRRRAAPGTRPLGGVSTEALLAGSPSHLPWAQLPGDVRWELVARADGDRARFGTAASASELTDRLQATAYFPPDFSPDTPVLRQLSEMSREIQVLDAALALRDLAAWGAKADRLQHALGMDAEAILGRLQGISPEESDVRGQESLSAAIAWAQACQIVGGIETFRGEMLRDLNYRMELGAWLPGTRRHFQDSEAFLRAMSAFWLAPTAPVDEHRLELIRALPLAQVTDPHLLGQYLKPAEMDAYVKMARWASERASS